MHRLAVVLACVAAAAPAWAQVTRLSVSTAGVQADGLSSEPAISGDGRLVAFSSWATNLVAGDTNGLPDIFLRDRDTDGDGVFDEAGAVATTRLNLGPGSVQANHASSDPAITPDGRYVCFVSKATNLTATTVPAEVLQVYRLDRTTGAIVVVSVNDGGDAGDLHSTEPAMSDDGAIVAFTSVAANLVGGAQTTTSAIYVRDLAAAHTTRITPPGPQSIAGYSEPSISGDGRRLVFHAVNVQRPSIFDTELHDRTSGTTRRVGPAISSSAFLTASGSRVVLNDPIGQRVLRVAVDLETFEAYPLESAPVAISPSGRYGAGRNQRFLDMDLFAGGTGLLAPPYMGAAFDRQDRWLAYGSTASTLLPGNADTNGVEDVFAVRILDQVSAGTGTDMFWAGFFGVSSSSTGDADGDGATDAEEYAAGTHPTGTFRRFLAEGATGSFFTTTIALANPGTTDANVLLTFDRGDGTASTKPVWVPALRSVAVSAGGVPGLASADFSTTIESDQPVAATRVMAWDTLPTWLPRGYGSHAETALASASPTWLLAEGSTVLGFDLFYLLQNPQATATHATVRFLLPTGSIVVREYDLAPRSRTTIYVNQVPGLDETDVSGDISASAPVIVERAMYRSAPGEPFALGHESMGVTAPATQWFLAEGATGTFFDLYVLIANPGAADATVDARYARPDGSVVTRQYTVRANSRFSIFVDAIPGLEDTPVATTVTSANSVPIVVERAMYWPGGFFDYYEAHSSVGTTATARRWVVAGGDLGPGAQTFVLIANTSSVAGTAVVATLNEAGGPPPPPAGPMQVSLPPNSRTTIPITVASATFGVLVESIGATPVDLVVESAVYHSPGGVTWAAGANALATPLP